MKFTGISREGILYGHVLFLFCGEVFVHEADILIGNILDLLFGILCFVFAKAIFLKFLYLLDGVAADIADGYPGLFTFAGCPADEFPSSFFGERWHEQPDDITVIL